MINSFLLMGSGEESESESKSESELESDWLTEFSP